MKNLQVFTDYDNETGHYIYGIDYFQEFHPEEKKFVKFLSFSFGLYSLVFAWV